MSKRAVYLCAKCGGGVPAKRWSKHMAKCRMPHAALRMRLWP